MKDSDVVKAEYWYCIIGPTDRNALLPGSDVLMRQAVQVAFERLTGQDADLCSSGWGVDEDAKNRIVAALG